MIDLNKFNKEEEVIVPVINGNFQYNRKKFITGTNECGWFNVKIKGNSIKFLNKIIVEIINKNFEIIKGYVYNNNIIFQNFDVAKRKLNLGIMTQLQLNNSSSFSSIDAIIWEDKKVYYYRPNYTDMKIMELQNIFNSQEKDIKEIKGLTPELKTVYLFHEIQRQQIIEEQNKIKRKEELEKFKSTLQGRLLLAFGTVGAKIINYLHQGNRIVVDWKVDNNNFNSVIDARTFRIIEAGYCMSGYDKDHSVTSMIELAKDYIERKVVHKTRI